MSEDCSTESDKEIIQCAGCGVKEGGDIKLRNCTACYLVRYCGVKCQKEHRPKHKKECKKRAAELRDEVLFKQPETNYPGDCPICCVPISMDIYDSSFYSCCCKRICIGCSHANVMREKEGRLEHKCPFCRNPITRSEEEHIMNYTKRVEANDPVAMTQMGGYYYGNKGDSKKAFEYYTKAAALGNMNAHYNLSCMYARGDGVEKDKKKELYHLEEAAIGGHAEARHNLGNVEATSDRIDRAMKHWIIAAKQGDGESLKSLKKAFKMGIVSKEQFETALRGHKAAVDATKRPQREAAKVFYPQQSPQQRW
jgi:tetratricopeptide (TPR) repeat protein